MLCRATTFAFAFAATFSVFSLIAFALAAATLDLGELLDEEELDLDEDEEELRLRFLEAFFTGEAFDGEA